MRLMTYRTPQSVECVQASERALPLPTSISRFLKREIQAFHCSLLANSWSNSESPHVNSAGDGAEAESTSARTCRVRP